MPRGSRHVETGLLLTENGALVLLRDDGGRWRLDVGRSAHRLLGRRVRIECVREDFDLVAVKRIEAIG